MRESIIEIARDDEERESEELNKIRRGGETEMHLEERSEIGRRLKQRHGERE